MLAPPSPSAKTAPVARPVDANAVDSALRRLSRQPQPPWLHAEVARRMAQRLAVVKLRPATVLDWWGYTGASAALLAQAYPQARRVVVEPSAALVQRSMAATVSPWWSPRRWLRPKVEVAQSEPAPLSAQLLWANMMLHAAPDPPSLMQRWQRLLAADGFLMFSCLGPDTVRELRALYQRLGWPVAGTEFVDMHDLGDMLLHAGFADPVMDQEHLSLTWSSPQALLAELRGMGCNASSARWPGLCTPRWHDRLCRELQSLAGADGRLRLSFEIIYGHAFKAAPRPHPASETTVALQDMRAMLRPA